MSTRPGDIHTLLGKGSEFTGKLTFEGQVRIDGKFNGEISTKDTIVIGDGARVKADHLRRHRDHQRHRGGQRHGRPDHRAQAAGPREGRPHHAGAHHRARRQLRRHLQDGGRPAPPLRVATRSSVSRSPQRAPGGRGWRSLCWPLAARRKRRRPLPRREQASGGSTERPSSPRAGVKVPLPQGWSALVAADASFQAGPPGRPVLRVDHRKGEGDHMPSVEELADSHPRAVLRVPGVAGPRGGRRARSPWCASPWRPSWRTEDSGLDGPGAAGRRRVGGRLFLCATLPGASSRGGAPGHRGLPGHPGASRAALTWVRGWSSTPAARVSPEDKALKRVALNTYGSFTPWGFTFSRRIRNLVLTSQYRTAKVGIPPRCPHFQEGVKAMALPELLSPAISVAGVLLIGLITAALAGRQARPQPVPVRRNPPRRR